MEFIKILILFVYGLCFSGLSAKEFLCDVEINTSLIEGSNKSVFESLKSAISDYMNDTEFTDVNFEPNERIECRLFLTVREYSGDRIKGDLQLQSSRPVFNSSYQSPLLNFKDPNIEFDYREGNILTFNENSWTDNLTGILDYYAYLILALDFDSFSPKGGDYYFAKASDIVQKAQSSGEKGWKVFEDDRNRSAVINVFTDTKTSGFHDLIYNYHRRGLDEMVQTPDKGRAMISDSLKELKKIYSVAPQSVGFTLFRDMKLDELVNIYSKSPKEERENVYEILSAMYPAEKARLDKIRKGE